MSRGMRAARAAVFGRVFLVAQHLARLTDDALAPLGLTTSQWLLLAVVTKLPGGAPTLTEAASAYGTSRQNVKQVASQLVAKGYLELRPDPQDARALRLHPTPRVAEDFDGGEGRARGERLFETLFEGLDGEDVRALELLLGRWLEALGANGRKS